MWLLRGYHCVYNFSIGNVLVTFITLNLSLNDIYSCTFFLNLESLILESLSEASFVTIQLVIQIVTGGGYFPPEVFKILRFFPKNKCGILSPNYGFICITHI